MSDSKTKNYYPVLTPFKIDGAIVKPPSVITLSEDEAREYQNAGVLGDEVDAPTGGKKSAKTKAGA